MRYMYLDIVNLQPQINKDQSRSHQEKLKKKNLNPKTLLNVHTYINRKENKNKQLIWEVWTKENPVRQSLNFY